VFAAEEAEREADHLFFRIESAHEDTARSVECDGESQGEGVIVGHSPDFFFDRFQLIEFFDRTEIADDNCWRSHCGFLTGADVALSTSRIAEKRSSLVFQLSGATTSLLGN